MAAEHPSKRTCAGSGLPPASVTKTGPLHPRGTMVALRGCCRVCDGDYAIVGRRRHRVIRQHAAKEATRG